MTQIQLVLILPFVLLAGGMAYISFKGAPYRRRPK